MRNRLLSLVFASLLLALLGAACNQPGTSTTTGGNGDTGTVVLGIKSMLTTLGTLHVTIKAGGKTVVDETRTTADKNLAFPMEFRVTDLEDGERVDADIRSVENGFTILIRQASTDAIAGKELLLATELESSCVIFPGKGTGLCDETHTCVHGACHEIYIPGSKLPEYTPTWATVTTDVCKPQGASAPIVVVGEGQADYLPTEDGDLAQVEAGPQGGHHIWMAVRMKNLTQSGSITSLTGHFTDLGYDVGPFNVIFTFDPDEGGYCKIYGLRFQLDAGHDISEMLGHTLEVTATITDKDKAVGIGKRTVVLSKDILGQ